MADAVVTTQSLAPAYPNTMRGRVANTDISIDPGMPVTPGGDDNSQVIFARANSADTANVLGLASSAAEWPGQINIQYGGPITLTEDQWDAVTGDSGGLSPNAVYYLDEATAGRLTTTPPDSGGQFITPVGFAVSTTTLMIQIGVAQAVEG